MDAISQISSKYKVTYNGANITENISLHLLELNYTDNVSGASDELEIRVEDVNSDWINGWYPQKGAKLHLELGYQSGPMLRPNDFEIDEINLSGGKDSGDVVTIKALSAGVTKQLHTKRSYAHENKTLSEIVHTVASKYGLTVIGQIENIVIGRVTQHRENALTFLNRLANEYGYGFSIKDSKLSFVKLSALEAASKVTTIDKTDCISYDIKDKSSQVYYKATVKSHNPNKNKTVQNSYTVEQQKNNDGVEFSYLKEAGNALEVRTKTENEQQAIVKSEAALHFVNSLQQTATIVVIGNVLLVAGVNIELTGFGVCSGIWNILKSQHKCDKATDYTTEVELKRVIPATISKSKKIAKPVTKKAANYKVVGQSNNDGFKQNFIVVNR